MIFQDPRAHINPMRSIGQFMVEALVTTGGVSKADATRRAIASLSDVGVDRPERRVKQYPHELSGGLLQRVMIAAALLTEPSLLLADEPTTALDVTTQSEVMAIVSELRRERGMAMIFISHDLDLAAAVCDRTAVMYAGSVVELNSSTGLHDLPLHPYTAALGTARPSLTERSGRLTVIPGSATSASDAPDVGCAYASRCAHAASVCTDATPQLRAVGRGATRCVRSEEVLRHA
jgi:oligopeptide/dipeptide ABC transporter ATP-binding protein